MLMEDQMTKQVVLVPPRKTQTMNLGAIQRDMQKKLPRRILIVDDEPYNLMGLKIVLDAADVRINAHVDEVTNGLEAYKAVKKAH